jgi:hypothetical protein
LLAVTVIIVVTPQISAKLAAAWTLADRNGRASRPHRFFVDE